MNTEMGIDCLIGVRVSSRLYTNIAPHHFKYDLTIFVSKAFAQNHQGDYVITISGGIDSEVTAETFLSMGIPFRVLILSIV